MNTDKRRGDYPRFLGFAAGANVGRGSSDEVGAVRSRDANPAFIFNGTLGAIVWHVEFTFA